MLSNINTQKSIDCYYVLFKTKFFVTHIKVDIRIDTEKLIGKNFDLKNLLHAGSNAEHKFIIGL